MQTKAYRGINGWKDQGVDNALCGIKSSQTVLVKARSMLKFDPVASLLAFKNIFFSANNAIK